MKIRFYKDDQIGLVDTEQIASIYISEIEHDCIWNWEIVFCYRDGHTNSSVYFYHRNLADIVLDIIKEAIDSESEFLRIDYIFNQKAEHEAINYKFIKDGKEIFKIAEVD